MNKFNFDELEVGLTKDDVEKLYQWLATLAPQFKQVIAQELSEALLAGDSLVDSFIRGKLGESFDPREFGSKIIRKIYG